MRVSSAAIFTLATLAVSNATQQAKAAPTQNTNQEHKTATTDVVIVPDVETQTAQVETLTAPETTYAIEFSSQPISQPVVVRTNINNYINNNNNNNNNLITDANLVVTATNVQIIGANAELEQIIRKVIKTQTGGGTSQTQLQQDVAAILDTGLFANATVNSSNTSAGVNVVYQVQPIVVQALQLTGAKVLTYQVALENFQNQIGKDISPAALQNIVQQINQWYKDNGYTLARVLSIQPNRQGILTVNVAEGLVGDIKFRFLSEEGEKFDQNGNPIKGRSKADFIRQQLKLQPGKVFAEDLARQDIQTLYKLGLFQSVNVAFEGDAKKLDLIYELQEVGARSVNLGGGYNADDGISVIVSYRDQNVGGVNDTLSANVELNRQDVLFNTNFNSPYRETNPERLGYNIKTFRRRQISDTFDDKIKLPNGDKVREGKIGASVSLQQEIDGWDAAVGLNYTRVTIRDRSGNITPRDANNNQLSLSDTGVDDLATVSFTATKDKRDNPVQPTEGSILTFSTEQSIPVGNGQITMNRLRGNYSQFMPVNLFNSTKPQVFALNLQAGTVVGDLPPYETFNLGGSNSVRGYDGGKVGSGRSYVLASAEYRFPIFPIAGGVIFADFATDLGSGDTVIGEPANVRNKPGSGFGYGAGVRVDSPLGLIRADLGINDQGESRVHIGIGQKF
ncbi:BamA/TamA family outer membrane protein [Sphaerospermopsis kisseleviana CS-549]|uniref:BamA/TamA family outer membrane protein n=1 Tax=Sphaerospermopsis kisseleviana CS-549 TaxID=3021783 RepID=A0ABT4ZUP4_9CYAN|nr:BamA/TamA family outer membrane protein [Sphaerospermopsis kisseleviana]MDB9443135.1 BamA/TamA family outer membrane protein [Sphaerospermopsis kisseleviana CS-549]BAZ80866.1 surface antigen D15 domain-containing protein [Sphaerospermopsis kisseleviana NIES-73]